MEQKKLTTDLFFSKRSPGEKPLIVGHRGGAAYAPENTIAAVKYAVSLGLAAVELDVQLTKDDVFIFTHDRLIDGTPVAEFTYSELKSLRPDIAAFDEIIAIAKGRIGLMVHPVWVEDGNKEFMKKLAEYIAGKNIIDQTLVISFHRGNFRAFKEFNPGIRTGLIVEKEKNFPDTPEKLTKLAADAREIGVDDILIPAPDGDMMKITTEMVNYLREAGFGVEVGTTDISEKQARYALSLGAGMVTANNPGVLKSLSDGGFPLDLQREFEAAI